MTNKRWGAGEDALISARYPEMGAAGMLARGLLADRTREAISRRAYLLGVKHTKQTDSLSRFEMLWPLPAMNEPEMQDCVRLRNWRYPVEAGALMPVLGMTVPDMGRRVA